MLDQIDYKGKWFILQDKDRFDEDGYGMDYSIGEIDIDDISDEFLEDHVENCMYYGIPAYLGNNEELLDRIKIIEETINDSI